jgi:hypothetical protein
MWMEDADQPNQMLRLHIIASSWPPTRANDLTSRFSFLSSHDIVLVFLFSKPSDYCLSPLSPSPSFPPCTFVSPPMPVVRLGCAWWSGCFAGWSSPLLCSSFDALDCLSVFCVSERIFAFGAAEEFSDGSGRLEAGFGVSISFVCLGVVVKARS